MASELDIVSQIKSYWNNKSTGALFLKLSNEKLLQLFFVKGELQSIKYHGVTGMEALKHIPALVSLKSQFHEGAISRIVNDLPPTSDIIDMISDNSFNKVSTSANVAGITGEQKSIIETFFIEHVGPIGDIIFNEELQKANSMDELIKSLCRQMDDLDEQVRFKEQIQSALKK